MTNLCGPLLDEITSINILTESGLILLTECATDTDEEETETPTTSTLRRGRFRKVVGRRHGTYIYKIVRTLTEDNF